MEDYSEENEREIQMIGRYYYLRNQNCFRAAIKRYEKYLTNSYSNYKYALEGGYTVYPTKYPCFITINTQYFGYYYPSVTVYDKERIKCGIETYKNLLEILER